MMLISQKIYFLIDDNTSLRYLMRVISRLSDENHFKILLVAREESLVKDINRLFPGIKVVVGYSLEMIYSMTPDLIICCQIWWWGIIPVLKEAVNRNIPILHYDHGSLISTCEYLMDGEAGASRYRSDVYLCSHIACWGQRPKQCWVSYAVLEEKLHVTGAMHLDHLCDATFDQRSIRLKLGIPQDKIILLCYTTLVGQNQLYDEKQYSFIQAVERFVTSNPSFHLVVKPHPSEMIFFKQSSFPFAPSTTLIANPVEDCRWQNVIRITPEEVMAVSDAVLSPFSSVLASPLSQNKPIVIFDYGLPMVQDFISYCTPAMTIVSDPAQLSEAVQMAIQQQQNDTSDLAQRFNFGIDGKATDRFTGLIDKIVADKQKGVSFYIPEIDEINICLRRYPFLPYPYCRMIRYNLEIGNDKEVDYWLNEYIRLFKDSYFIYKDLFVYYLGEQYNFRRARICLKMMRKCDASNNDVRKIFKDAIIHRIISIKNKMRSSIESKLSQ